jgi:UrcA family protein
MKTFTQNTIRTAILATLGVLGTATALAQPAPGAVESASAKTSFAGLDLSTPEGLAAARERVHRTARQLCSEVAHSTDLAHQPNFIKCVDATMAAALQQLTGLTRPVAETSAAASPAKPAVPSYPLASSKTLSFADLDLSTPAGAQAAHERLHQVARTVCAQVADDLDLSHHANYLACIDKTMADAMPKLEELARRNAPSPHGIAQNLAK